MTQRESYLLGSGRHGKGKRGLAFQAWPRLRAWGESLHVLARAVVRPRQYALRPAMTEARRLARGALPLVTVDEVAADAKPTLVGGLASDEALPEGELVVLLRIVIAIQPRAVLEIGTAKGRTTMHLAVNTPRTTSITTLDLPEGHLQQFHSMNEVGSEFRDTEVAPRIRQVLVDSTTWDFQGLLGQVDLVFVDANHEANPVISDSLAALDCLRDGRGTILWHDYGTWPGVTDGLERLRRLHPAFAQLRSIESTSLAILRRP